MEKGGMVSQQEESAASAIQEKVFFLFLSQTVLQLLFGVQEWPTLGGYHHV